ncbi:MAG: alpha/beta fold hydrolase [Chloroflexi bacterium]|nr:alpha/beta fold hydrolase [Chloroflexota bacterium]
MCDAPCLAWWAYTHGRAARGNRQTIVNDFLRPPEWESFVRAWSKLLFSHVDGAVYFFMSSLEWPLVSRLLGEAGGHWSDTIIWMKDQFTLGRADYQRQYEPIWYGWQSGTKLHWCGDRGQGRPLVLLAGLGGTAHIYRSLAPRLTPRFHVVALTRRGHGRSERPETGYELDTLVDDILRFLDEIKIERAVFVGHSKCPA